MVRSIRAWPNVATISRSSSTSASSSCLRSHTTGSIVGSTTAILLSEFREQILLRMKRWSLLSRTLGPFVHHVRGLYPRSLQPKAQPLAKLHQRLYSGRCCGGAWGRVLRHPPFRCRLPVWAGNRPGQRGGFAPSGYGSLEGRSCWRRPTPEEDAACPRTELTK